MQTVGASGNLLEGRCLGSGWRTAARLRGDGGDEVVPGMAFRNPVGKKVGEACNRDRVRIYMIQYKLYTYNIYSI